MNTRKNAGRRVGEAAAGGNHGPPQAPAAGVQEPVNPTALTDGEVREALVHMAQKSLLKHIRSQPKRTSSHGQVITTQAHSITTQPLERVLPGITHMLVPWLVT